MGFREKISKRFAESYYERYKDRLVSLQGNVISVKLEEKVILWLFHKLRVVLLLRPDRSKAIIKCVYDKNRWFKKVQFIPISQGNFVMIQGMKGKKGKEDREIIQIMNVINQSNKKELIHTDVKPQRIQQKYQRMK